MTDLDAKTLLKGNAIFTEFKGALTEQYVCQPSPRAAGRIILASPSKHREKLVRVSSVIPSR